MVEHCDSPMWALPVILCCRIWIVGEGIAYAQHCVDLCSVCGQNLLEPFERGHWHICTDLYQIIKSAGHVSGINFQVVLQLKQKEVAQILMGDIVAIDADMCDFGDLGCGTAAVHHLHSFMIFTWPLFQPHLGWLYVKYYFVYCILYIKVNHLFLSSPRSTLLIHLVQLVW